MKMRRFLSAILATALVSSTLVFTGCGSDLKSDEVMVTIGNDKISMKDMKGFVALSEIGTELNDYQMMMMYANYYQMQYDKTTWESDDSIKQLREQTMNDFVEKYIMRKEADKKGGYEEKITDKVLKDMKKNAKALMDACSDKMKDNGGLSEEDFVEYQKLTFVYNAYHEDVLKGFGVKKDDVKGDIDYDNEYRQYKTTYYKIPYVKTNQDGTTTNLSDKEKAKAKSDMEKVAGLLDNGKSKDDITKEFEKAGLTAEEKNYQQSEAYPDKVKKKDDKKDKKEENNDDAQKPDAYIEQSKTLKKGQHTKVFEYDNAYCIAMMDDTDSKEAYDNAVNEAVEAKKKEKYDDMLKKLKESKDYKVSIADAWEDVDFGSLVIDRDEFDKAEGKISKNNTSAE